MRKIWIDTDTGSDDAVALMIAALSEDVEIVGVSAVCGNVTLPLAVKNALMTLEICRCNAPVYPGADRPLFRELVTAVRVHGEDGMGDLDLIHPSAQASQSHAVDMLLQAARRYPDELEIITLGPATNVATAILRDREAMSHIRRIYSMGTAGFGPGNCTPVSEFNVYVDADSYRILLESGIPLTIAGGDVCMGEAVWNMEDMESISASGPIGKFAVDCNAGLLRYHQQRNGQSFVDLPDAVAMGVALWPEIVTGVRHCHCFCCTTEDRCYGQVIFYDPHDRLAIDNPMPEAEADIISSINAPLYKQKLEHLLASSN